MHINDSRTTWEFEPMAIHSEKEWFTFPMNNVYVVPFTWNVIPLLVHLACYTHTTRIVSWFPCQTIYHRLRLEPMCWNSNLVKTQFGTWTYVAGTQTHVAGTWTQPKPCLGHEPTWLGFKSRQNLAWDSNPAKSLLGTWTHVAGTQTQPKPMIPGFRT